MDYTKIGDSVYEIFTDPIWQSIGVILGAAGVAYGAYLGSKIAHRLEAKKQEVELRNAFDNYIISFEEELRANLECIHDIKGYVYLDHPPIPEAFEPVKVGSSHLRFEVWDSMLRQGMMKFFTYEEFRELSLANKNVIRLARIAQIYASNWDRVRSLKFNETGRNNHADLISVIEAFMYELSETMKYCVDTISQALEIITPKIKQ